MLVVINLKNKISISDQSKFLKELNVSYKDKLSLIVAPLILENNDYKNFNLASQNIGIPARCVGDIGPEQLKHYNIRYSFVGHLERQKHLNECRKLISLKVKNALNNNIIPIICLGLQKDICNEFEGCVKNVDFKNKHIIVAYEILNATLKGSRDYEFTHISHEYKHIKNYLEDIKQNNNNFSYDLIFGGGISKEDIPDIIEIGFDGVLIGDRRNVCRNVLKGYVNNV